MTVADFASSKSPEDVIADVFGTADAMQAPGAVISGFIRPSLVGPLVENVAIVPTDVNPYPERLLVTNAPTVIMPLAVPPISPTV